MRSIYIVEYEVTPKPDNPKFGRVGGAFVNCYIKANSEAEAEKISLHDVEQHWAVVLDLGQPS